MSADSILNAVFDGLDRLAPGSEASTLRALEIARRVLEPARMLDIGCGTGTQSLVLVRNTRAGVTAVDTSESFLATLRARAAREELSGRVATLARAMTDLNLPSSSFDLIWSEGAIYIMGFDVALRAWREFLEPGGVLACSELTWLTDTPSQPCAEFWRSAYPAMRTQSANIVAADASGFDLVEAFALPPSDWTESYYAPLRRRVESLKPSYAADAVALAVLADLESEIGMYESFGAEYGYVFYILRRRD